MSKKRSSVIRRK